MKFDGGMFMLGAGGVVGKWLGDAIIGYIPGASGWVAAIVQFLVGVFAMSWKGGGTFSTGFGVVNLAGAVSRALHLLGVTLPALTTPAA